MWPFDPKEHSLGGKANQRVRVFAIAGAPKDHFSKEQFPLGSDLEEQINKLRQENSADAASRKAFAPAAAVHLLVAGGRFIFDQVLARREKKLEELKARASQSYSGTIILESGVDFRNQIAFLLTRHQKEKPEGSEREIEVLKFAALLKIRKLKSAKAFTLEPVYVRAANAVAVTSEKCGVISVSLALAIKTLTQEKDAPVEVVASGQGAVTVAKVEIGSGKKPFLCPDDGDCPASDLVPYPPGSEPCSVTFAVTETGDFGFDIDAKIAEIKALKEAMGPALTESLTELLKKKDE